MKRVLGREEGIAGHVRLVFVIPGVLVCPTWELDPLQLMPKPVIWVSFAYTSREKEESMVQFWRTVGEVVVSPAVYTSELEQAKVREERLLGFVVDCPKPKAKIEPVLQRNFWVLLESAAPAKVVAT